MPFDAATLAIIEDALSDCFQYHSNLDSFLLRSGMSASQLASARAAAEARAAGGRFPKAPKRFVAQAVLSAIGALGADGDRLCANLVTALLSMKFSGASPSGVEALDRLKEKVGTDREMREEKRQTEKDEQDRALRDADRMRQAARSDRIAKRDALRDRFLALMQEANAQARGYLLEAFLRDLFEHENLEPRKSFRVSNEQIDGSFVWRGRTSLLEANG